jgi:hypothetical protein
LCVVPISAHLRGEPNDRRGVTLEQLAERGRVAGPYRCQELLIRRSAHHAVHRDGTWYPGATPSGMVDAESWPAATRFIMIALVGISQMAKAG